MPFDLGDTARLEAECRTAAGSVTNAATVVLTVTLPDGTTASPAVTNPPSETGKYVVDYTTTMVGRHAVRWVFTDPASAYTDVFDVSPAESVAILSLADAKAQLNTSSVQDDGELRFWIDATTAAVEFFTGPVVVRSVVEDYLDRVLRALALRQTPVVEVVSVEPLGVEGSAYSVDSLVLDPETGIVTARDGARLRGPLRVTYRAGRAAVPSSISAAARIILQHLWRSQMPQARGALAGGGNDWSVTEPIPGLGYAIPNRALQLLEPFRLPPGVA